jgi:hypothetical protein
VTELVATNGTDHDLHETILHDGHVDAAVTIGRETAKQAGLADAELRSLYGY